MSDDRWMGTFPFVVSGCWAALAHAANSDLVWACLGAATISFPVFVYCAYGLWDDYAPTARNKARWTIDALGNYRGPHS